MTKNPSSGALHHTGRHKRALPVVAVAMPRRHPPDVVLKRKAMIMRAPRTPTPPTGALILLMKSVLLRRMSCAMLRWPISSDSTLPWHSFTFIETQVTATLDQFQILLEWRLPFASCLLFLPAFLLQHPIRLLWPMLLLTVKCSHILGGDCSMPKGTHNFPRKPL